MEALPQLIAENFFFAALVLAVLGLLIGVLIRITLRRRRK
jgi:hypothetical protein